MAKSRKILIEVIVDDKGTTQKLAVDSKKLEKALAGSAQKTKDADRALRGTANMSSNTTKNFSKMTQGISGGIVPAYAELAARVFAVTAAFRFLQEAADTRNLLAGQQQLGAVMGTNYAGITKSLQEATAGQLKFKDAAQATAIGTAAGLTSNQLEGLATAAKNVSFALGRDLTDSFNRLIRGVTKSEPELLDELGIILRLEPATKAYADQLGKAAKDLTAFEKSQAVANFVLEEADRKFAKISQVMDEDAFAVSQFGKVFDDLMNSMKVGIANTLTPVLQFLSNNVASLVSLFGLLALPLVKSVLPNLDNFTKGADAAGKAAEKMATKAQTKFDGLSKQTRILGKTMDDVTKSADDLSAGAGVGKGQKTGSGLAFLSGDDKGKAAQNQAGRILGGAQKQMDRDGKITTGKLQGYNKQQLADLQLSYQQRAAVVKKFETKTRMSMKGIALTAKQTAVGIQVAFTKAFASISRGATMAAKGVDRAFKAAGLIGLILLFVDLGKMAFDALFPISAEAKRAQDELSNLTGKSEELSTHLAKVNEIRADVGLLNLNEAAQQLGNAVQEANLGGKGGLIDQINTLDTKKGTEGFAEYKESLVETANQMAALDPRFEALSKALNEGTTVEGTEAMLEFANSTILVSKALSAAANNQKAVDQEISNITNSIAKKPFESLIKALETDMKAKVQLVAEFDSEGFTRETERIEAERKKFELGTDIQTTPIYETQTGYGGFLKKVKIGEDTTRTQTAEDEAEEQRLRAILDARKKMKADNEANAASAKRVTEFAIGQQTKALGIQEKIFKNKEDVLAIDQISQSFEAKKARLKIAELNQDSKIEEARKKVLEAEIGLRSVREGGAEEGSAELENAKKAVINAGRQVAIEETILSNIEKQNKAKSIQIDIEKAKLKIQREINATENALNAAQQLQQRRQTGFGSIGANVDTLNQEKSAAVVGNAQARILSLSQQINKEEAGRANAVALGQQGEIDRINQAQQALALQILQQGIIIENETNKAAILTQALDLENQITQKKIQAISLNPVQQAMDLHLLENGLQRKDLSAEELALLQQKITKAEELNIVQEGTAKLRDSITGGMESAFMSLVDGSKSAKEAFADMAKSILASLAQMIIKMLVFKAIQAATGFFGGPSGRDGMISEPVPARRGGILQGYSTGGIARGRQAGYPAILHGTEAVVPLPNKKEIPVDIRGGTGNVNNININIASDGTTKESGDQGNNSAARLGRVVSVAIQEELQKQKRPGGILSPYGAAS